MNIIFLLMWAIAPMSLAPLVLAPTQFSVVNNQANPENSLPSPEAIKERLHHEAATLSAPVLDNVVAAIHCARARNVEHNHIVTVIDYSLPSNEKRLWIFDLKENKLLFHTYVSHGIKSGTLFTNNFSNKYNSKASSIGVYKTDKAYYGREGLSLRLSGLEPGYNDNASNRSIVMHGGWYMSEEFIKKYGRPGRSWGCPAVPHDLYQPIINTIKENSLFLVYYPSENWLVKSKFLHCQGNLKPELTRLPGEVKPPVVDNEFRDEVLFAHVDSRKINSESDAIVTMSADNYERTFHARAPLGRMLRRQIDKAEYIALSTAELNTIVREVNQGLAGGNKDVLNTVYFVMPVLKMIRGYYETQMQIIPFGRIKEVKSNADSSGGRRFTVYFETRPAISLKASNQFIRWLGL